MTCTLFINCPACDQRYDVQSQVGHASDCEIRAYLEEITLAEIKDEDIIIPDLMYLRNSEQPPTGSSICYSNMQSEIDKQKEKMQKIHSALFRIRNAIVESGAPTIWVSPSCTVLEMLDLILEEHE